MKAIINFFKSERGTASVEMGLICALIVLAMLTALQSFAHGNVSMWETVSSKTTQAISGSGS